jgi:hypothetical protein
LICDREQVEELILGLENIDPHYKIIGYVSTDTTQRSILVTIICKANRQKWSSSFVNKNGISEIVIASKETEGITADLYQQLIKMLESGKLIREYTQCMKAKPIASQYNILREIFIVFSV